MSIDTRTLGNPVDRVAGQVSSRGESFDVNYGNVANKPWDSPIKTVPVLKNMEDLTGIRRGRLTVIGRIDPKIMNSKGGSYWLVRCDCGKYHKRKAKAIKNPNNT